MGYSDAAMLAADYDFQQRVAACIATETAAEAEPPNAPNWAAERAWQMAAQPGFADKYASALAANPPVERPGWDASVISDAEILSAVQAIASAPEV
jgi:hypothetical protein